MSTYFTLLTKKFTKKVKAGMIYENAIYLSIVPSWYCSSPLHFFMCFPLIMWHIITSESAC